MPPPPATLMQPPHAPGASAISRSALALLWTSASLVEAMRASGASKVSPGEAAVGHGLLELLRDLHSPSITSDGTERR